LADNSYRISKSLSLNPQTVIPTSPVNGDAYYDANQGSFVLYDNGFWINVASQTDIAANATLDSANFTAAVVQNPLVRVTGSVASNLYGLTASTGSKQVVVYNESSGILTVYPNNSTEPTASNRIVTPNNDPIEVGAGQSITLIYDSSQARWIVASGFSGNASLAEEVPLTIGTTIVTVTYPSALPSTAYGIVCQLVNETDAYPEFQPITITNKTTTGFTATWNGALNSSNYFLDYIVGPGGSSTASGEYSVISGATSAVIAFPSVGTTSYVVVTQFENLVDSHVQFQPTTVTSKAVNQFTLSWNGPTASSNYRISWEIVVYT
jgi:hypothetical protein